MSEGREPECYLCAGRPAAKCPHCQIPLCEWCKKSHDKSRKDDFAAADVDFSIPMRPGPHSSIDDARENIEYVRERFHESLRIPAEYFKQKPSLAAEDIRHLEGFKKECRRKE